MFVCFDVGNSFNISCKALFGTIDYYSCLCRGALLSFTACELVCFALLF